MKRPVSYCWNVEWGDKYHQLLLETGLNTILEKVLEWNTFWDAEHGLMFGHKESDIDKEWTPLDEEEKNEI